MTAYWDALARAALGLPGSASLRPTSRFESEEAGRQPEDFEPIEVPAALPMATGAFPAPPDGPAREAPRAAAPARPPVPVQGPYATPPPQAPRARDDGPTGDRQPVVASAEATTPATFASAPSAAPMHTIERLQVERVETRRTVIETMARPEREPAAEHDTATPVAPPIPAEAQPSEATREPIVARDPERAMTVVAEPVAIPSLEARAVRPSVDLAPLVIEIDRVDIRIEPETSAGPAPSRAPVSPSMGMGPVPSLSDYLARRSEARG